MRDTFCPYKSNTFCHTSYNKQIMKLDNKNDYIRTIGAFSQQDAIY